MGKKGKKGGAPQRGKGTLRRKETKKNGGRKGGAPCKGRSVAKVEEEFMGRVEEKSRVVLWTNSATRCRVMGAGMAQSRGRCHVFEMPKIWRRRMLCGRRSQTRDSSLLEKRKDELVWMQRKRGAERRVSKRLERYSKEGRKRRAHREEKRSKS